MKVWEKKYKGKTSSIKDKKGYAAIKTQADKKFGKKTSLVKNMWISKQLKKGQEQCLKSVERNFLIQKREKKKLRSMLKKLAKKCPRKNSLKLVEITWIDSGRASGEWGNAEDTMKKPMPVCLSIGYWYDQNKEKILIYGAIELDKEGNPIKGTEGSEQEILKKCVEKVHFIDA